MKLAAPRDLDRPALVEAPGGRVVTYGGLDELGRATVAALGPSRRLLFLFCRNDVFTVAAYVGALRAGHPVALLDGDGPADLQAGVVNTYRPVWLAGPAGLGASMAEHDVPVAEVLHLPGGELVRTDHLGPEQLHRDLAVLLATSGTTGSRRFVRLSRRNVEANAGSIAAYLGLTPDERPVSSLPLHYSFGLSVLNSHLLVGATVILTGSSVVQRPFWDAVATHGCTSLAGVPFTYQLLERVGFRDMALPALRSLQQAGGALDLRLTLTYAEHMAGRGGRFYVMYGQTEATARIAYVPPDRLPEKLGSAGIAIPGGRLRIDVDGAGEDAGGSPPRGEVVYEGPNVMLGYADGPADLAAGDQLNGVLRTGDLGYLDGEGFLFLVGRSKRIAKVFGLRVNLDEVEMTLREHGPAAVVGGDDCLRAFCAFGTEAELEALAGELARRYRLHPTAVRLRRVDAVPTTTAGKIDYRKVEAWTTS